MQCPQDQLQLAGSFLKVLEEDYSLDLNDWRCNVGDWCAVNGAMITKVVERCKLNVTEIDCISHGICNSGKHFEVPHADRASKGLTKIVKYPLCKARHIFEEQFNEKPLKSGGTRWWSDWEQYQQVDRLGLDNVRDQHVATCFEQKYSELSAKGLLEYLEDKERMAKSMVEMAAVVDAGRRLVEITYKAESKQPMVLVMFLLLQELITKIQYNDTPTDCLDLACQAAASIMQEVLAPLHAAVAEATSVEQEYEEKLHGAQDALISRESRIQNNQLQLQQQAMEEATALPRRSGRSRQQHNYANMHRGQGVAATTTNDVDNDGDGRDEAGELPEFHLLQEAKAAYVLKAVELTKQEEKLETFLLNHPTSPSDFFQHGAMAVEHGSIISWTSSPRLVGLTLHS